MATPVMTELARHAYHAYGQTTGHKNYAGLPMPAWDDLGDRIQAAWVAAVAAICDQQEVIRLLHRIDRKVNHIMTDQEKLDTDVAAIKAGLGVVAQEIADLKAAAGSGQPLDFSGLDQAVSDLNALAPAAPPAPPAG